MKFGQIVFIASACQKSVNKEPHLRRPEKAWRGSEVDGS